MRRIVRVSRELVSKVLTDGLGYEPIDVPVVGNVVRMSAREAFVYAVVTAHGYLDTNEPDNMYRLTRDSFRIFNQAEQYELQEGIFSLSDLRFVSTVNNEVIKKPYIAKGDKFVLPIEYAKYNQFQLFLREISQKLESNGYNPNDFIICPIRKSDSRTVELESFFEFAVSTYFNRNEYLTDTQIPFYYGVGTPDVAAYRIPELMEKLKKNGFITTGGSPIDLMAISVFGFCEESITKPVQDEAIVIEVKTNQISAPQILKYTNTKIFNKAYEAIPCIKQPESYAGLITLDAEGHILVFECKNPVPFSRKRQKRYFNWLKVYLKFYLIANLTTIELEELMKLANVELNRKNLLWFVKTSSVDKLIQNVRNFLGKRE